MGNIILRINSDKKLYMNDWPIPAFRETAVTVQLLNFAPSLVGSLIMTIFSRGEKVAECSSFSTDVNGVTTGTLDLGTTEMVAIMEKYLSREKKKFQLTLWDDALEKLLINDDVWIMSNPYNSELPQPNAITSKYLLRNANNYTTFTIKAVPVVADLLLIEDSADGFAKKGIAISTLPFEPVNANIQAHISSTSNPHSTTYAQVGAEPANSNIQAHILRTDNPHATTYTQVGAERANANIQAHISSAANPHGVTLAQVGGEAANVNIQAHIGLTASNPHGVTKTHIGLPNVPDVNCTIASNITSGTLDGDRLPAMSTAKAGAVPPTVDTDSSIFLSRAGWGVPAGAGDVKGPAITNENYIATWDATTRTLKSEKQIGNSLGFIPSRSAANALDADEVKEITTANGVLIDGVRIKDDTVILPNIAIPSTPSAGYGRIYGGTSTALGTMQEIRAIDSSGESYLLSNRLVSRLTNTIDQSSSSTVFETINLKDNYNSLGSGFLFNLSAVARVYQFEGFFPFSAENASYGFTLSTSSNFNNSAYTVMIPLTATTMYYSNQYADDTGTASATTVLRGTARIFGTCTLGPGSGWLYFRIKVENALHPITLLKGSLVNLYKITE